MFSSSQYAAHGLLHCLLVSSDIIITVCRKVLTCHGLQKQLVL